MKPYNGFDHDARMAGLAVCKEAWESGRLPRPQRLPCEVCGARPGWAHNEDYTTPLRYYVVCFVCHMMIHCRFRDPFRWGQYVQLLEDGAWFRRARHWHEFRRLYLEGELAANVIEMQTPRARSFVHHLPVVDTQSVPPNLPPPARFSA